MGLLNKEFKSVVIDSLLENIANSSSNYFIFSSKSNDEILNNTDYENSFIPTNRMIFGKKLDSTCIRSIIKNIPWTSGDVYDEYNNTVDLTSKKYYVCTAPEVSGGFRHVYKCISNNKGTPSLYKPNVIQNTIFSTLDGYKWKYMYSISSQEYSRYGSDEYIPVTPNTSVIAAANSSTGIYNIDINISGDGYLTYHEGLVSSVLNPTTIQISTSANPDNDFYKNSSIYLYNTSSPTSQISEITSYVANSSGKFCVLATAANTEIIYPSLTKYIISPTVKFIGDGVGASAYSVVSNNQISNINIINPGMNYTHSRIEIIANTTYGTGAEVISITPPVNGHGSYPKSELGVEGFVLSSYFKNTESSTLPVEGSYSSVGIIKNPRQFSNTSLYYDANTFNSTIRTFTSSPVQFTEDELVVGETSGAVGQVFFSNTSVLILAGDKNFANNEIVTGQTSGLSTSININSYGDIDTKRSNVLYVTNINKISRNPQQSELLKLFIQL